jgi:glutathione S-transferase
MPVLHGVSLSPFVRKVRIALAEKGIAYELESVMPGSPDPSFRSISPLGKVPVYQEGEFSLPDSSVICAYLERRHPKPPLYPSDDREYARALWFEEYADTKLIEVFNPVFFQRVVQRIVFKQQSDEELVKRALTEAIPFAFDYLEREVPKDGWIVGDSFGIADLSIGAMFVGLRHGRESVDRGRWPKLAAYVARVDARPSVAALIAEEEASLAAL